MKKTDVIQLGHGSGGQLMGRLIRDILCRDLGCDPTQLDDAAVMPLKSGKVAFTTDSYTITPIFFPGGDIGSLAVNGTVNDLAVMGARPQYLSCGLILEEGFPIDKLETIMQSMGAAARAAGVRIVTGDTKVVEKGKGDQIYINTSGIGIFDLPLQRAPVLIGDRILINGSIGDHGIAIMALRNGLSFSAGLKSDCAPLFSLIRGVTAAFPDSIRFMRDATRGGVAAVLNEITAGNDFGIRLLEKDLPLREEVTGVCDLLGIDPLYSANEGKVIMVTRPEVADDIVACMRDFPEGKEANVIGEVVGEFGGQVYVETAVRGKRLLPLLIEEQLPRIC